MNPQGDGPGMCPKDICQTFSKFGDQITEVHFTFYTGRDVNTAARKRNGSYRFAVKGTELFDDYGVMILEEDAPANVQPILLQKVNEGNSLTGMVAGCIGDKVKIEDRIIYRNPAVIETNVLRFLHYPIGTTQPGMSGGPVLVGDGQQATAIGIIHGEGTINQQKYDLAKSINQTTLDSLQELIRQSEAG